MFIFINIYIQHNNRAFYIYVITITIEVSLCFFLFKHNFNNKFELICTNIKITSPLVAC